MTDLDGCVTGRWLEGFYVDNTRVLSRGEIFVGGQRLHAFAATPVGGDAFLAYAEVPARAGLPERSVFVEIAHFVSGGLCTGLRVVNHSQAEQRCEVWRASTSMHSPPTQAALSFVNIRT